MKVIEHLNNSKKTLYSFEIVPPPRGQSIKEVTDVVKLLDPLKPAWIDVTSHSSVMNYNELEDGSIRRRTSRKRPGTIGLCGVIQNRFKIDTVAHVLCLGFSREETEDALIELSYLGIQNILALRGDAPNFQKEIRKDRTHNYQASDLVKQIVELNHGHFLDRIENSQQMDFCIGVAGYPEKHLESPNFKTDLHFLKKKVDAGADYMVTQMFFDNAKYFEFVKKCRETGIHIPIIPGLKIIRSVAQLKSLPKTFNIDIPEELSESILSNPKQAHEIGYNWCLKQSEELLAAQVPSLHYYVLNDGPLVVEVVKNIQERQRKGEL